MFVSFVHVFLFARSGGRDYRGGSTRGRRDRDGGQRGGDREREYKDEGEREGGDREDREAPVRSFRD